MTLWVHGLPSRMRRWYGRSTPEAPDLLHRPRWRPRAITDVTSSSMTHSQPAKLVEIGVRRYHDVETAVGLQPLVKLRTATMPVVTNSYQAKCAWLIIF